jgi:hypothetical protein
MYSNCYTSFVNYLMSSFSHPFSSIAIIVLSKLGQLLSMQWVYEYIDDIRFPESRNHFGYEIPFLVFLFKIR